METKYIAPTKWEQCEREDLNMIPTMIAKGFTPEFNPRDKRAERTVPENCPHDAVSFVKGDLHVWRAYKQGFSYWMTAKLIDGYYCKHEPVKELTDLFK